MSSYIFLVLFILITNSNLCFTLKLKLIHIDILAPSYDSEAINLKTRHKRWTELSVGRFYQIYQDLVGGGLPLYSGLILDGKAGALLVSIGLGNPPIPQFVVMDTGSNIMWVTCMGSPYVKGNYNYKKSEDYHPVYCSHKECRNVPFSNYYGRQKFSDSCTLGVQYKSSNKVIQGEVVWDSVTFWEGLDGEDWSMATQFRSRFSYCVGDLHNNASSEFNHLLLDEAHLLGSWTPIRDFSTKIYINFTYIIVGEEVLDIASDVFVGGPTNLNGTILDCGSFATFLANLAFSADNPCFYNLHPNEVPTVHFVFEMGAQLVLGMDNLFAWVEPDKYCFSIKPSSSTKIPSGENLTVIGLDLQQFHNIGCDYKARRIHFDLVDCENLPII
uniref:Xylanase inhibitor N-terminal domain-containing protein n=1 Tax=Kalanchoe fedtschenkoi TaxID=63787 RepID=A0A7N0VJ23_KALFE